MLLFTPVYAGYLASFRALGMRMVESPLLAKGKRLAIDWEGLRTACTERVKVLVFANPHNPCGTVWTREDLQRLLAFARERGVTLVSDEVMS